MLPLVIWNSQCDVDRQGGRINSLLIQYDDNSQLHNDSNGSPLSIIDLYVLSCHICWAVTSLLTTKVSFNGALISPVTLTIMCCSFILVIKSILKCLFFRSGIPPPKTFLHDWLQILVMQCNFLTACQRNVSVALTSLLLPSSSVRCCRLW